MIVLDTSILSLVFRRASGVPGKEVAAFAALVRSDEPMAVPGIVLQELLSGVKTEAAWNRLEDALSGFPLLLPTRETHLRAARLSSQCRAHGVAAATADYLIAAHALEEEASLFTRDEDFVRIARHSDLVLLAV